MMKPLRFYGDESGAHGKGTYLIAGYLATSENWEHFKALWTEKLAGPRHVDYFKRGANYHGNLFIHHRPHIIVLGNEHHERKHR